MYKNIITISQEEIESLGITAQEKFDWVDTTLRHKSEYVLPTKTRMPLKENDYFNVMPCALPSENILGLKVVTRNENRRLRGLNNIDGDILLYSYDNFMPMALIDGAYITTIRTAAVAVHSLLNFASKREVIAMVGLGNIGTEIGNILFPLIKNNKTIIKLYRYKDQAEKFAAKFSHYTNLEFQYCNTYESLMADSDVVVSSITSDLISIKKFQNYDQIKKLSYIDDLIACGRYTADKQTIIYNLGLAIYDLFFAAKIYNKLNQK